MRIIIALLACLLLAMPAYARPEASGPWFDGTIYNQPNLKTAGAGFTVLVKLFYGEGQEAELPPCYTDANGYYVADATGINLPTDGYCRAQVVEVYANFSQWSIIDGGWGSSNSGWKVNTYYALSVCNVSPPR